MSLNSSDSKPDTSVILFKNESLRLKGEFEDLKKHNPRLIEIIEFVAHYSERDFEKSIVITHIYRTKAEQDNFYKDNPKYQKKKWISPHQMWHAVDLRSRVFTPEETEELVAMINDEFGSENYYATTSLFHNVGFGDHIHIQFVDKN